MLEVCIAAFHVLVNLKTRKLFIPLGLTILTHQSHIKQVHLIRAQRVLRKSTDFLVSRYIKI